MIAQRKRLASIALMTLVAAISLSAVGVSLMTFTTSRQVAGIAIAFVLAFVALARYATIVSVRIDDAAISQLDLRHLLLRRRIMPWGSVVAARIGRSAWSRKADRLWFRSSDGRQIFVMLSLWEKPSLLSTLERAPLPDTVKPFVAVLRAEK